MSTRSISIGTYNVTPLYQRLSASGTNDKRFKRAWNPYTFSNESYSISPSPYGYWEVPSSYIIPWTDDDDARLADKIVKAVRGHEFNAGVFIGQSHELASSVVGATSAIIAGVRSLKKGDFGGALRSLSRTVSGTDIARAEKRLKRNDIAGTWLALQYGWLPVYSDVHAAAKAFEVLSAPPRTSRLYAVRNKAQTVKTTVGPYNCELRAKRFVRYYLELREELPYARNMGLDDPLSVAWELMPWSFVADWFIPIGRYLSQLAVLPKLIGTAYCTAGYSSDSSLGSVNNPGVNYKYVGAMGTHRLKHIVRYSPGNIPTAVPPPKFVGFENIFKSSTRTLNAIALLSQSLKGR